ncbi:hypothetical protein AB838_06235 [Rhodobacteraceae bacterium (ex Bugula neritina AB1)]|nr:hypothetical protein AB838_06235 [Rhodobacteraceae bacterium (ex Bugula neritina AB1)]
MNEIVKKCLTGSYSDTGSFPAPSAGAIYPYQFILAPHGADGAKFHSAFEIGDIGEVMEAGVLSDFESISIYILYLPERTVSKYGSRGFFYGLQDCGHVLGSLIAGAKTSGTPFRARVFSGEKKIRSVFGRSGPVIVAAITLGGKRFDPFSPDVLGRIQELHPEVALPFSESSWDSVRDAGWLGGMETLPLLNGMTWNDFSAAVTRRRSAEGFSGDCLGQARVVGLAKHASGAGLGAVFGPGVPIRVKAAIKEKTGVWNIYEQNGGQPERQPLLENSLGLISNTFLGQGFTETSSSLISFCLNSNSERDLFDAGISSGFLGQMFYLAATHMNVPICCVGGFEVLKLSNVLKNAKGSLPIYALVLGVGHVNGRKVDRERESVPRVLSDLLGEVGKVSFQEV